MTDWSAERARELAQTIGEMVIDWNETPHIYKEGRRPYDIEREYGKLADMILAALRSAHAMGLEEREAQYRRLRNAALAVAGGRGKLSDLTDAIKDDIQPGYAPVPKEPNNE